MNGNSIIHLEVQVLPGLGNAFFKAKKVVTGMVMPRASSLEEVMIHQCAVQRMGG